MKTTINLAALTLCLAHSPTLFAKCSVEGDAIDWAKDACLWQFETDNLTHKDVQSCLKNSKQHIETLGQCEAKQLFKRSICAQTSKWQFKEQCLKSNTPLGPNAKLNKKTDKPDATKT